MNLVWAWILVALVAVIVTLAVVWKLARSEPSKDVVTHVNATYTPEPAPAA